MEPRQQRSQRRRRALIRAAAEIATEHGFAAVSHRAVARRAEVPLGSTTYYFRSLDELLGAVAAWMVEEWLARGAAVRDAAAPGPYRPERAAALLTRAVLPGEEYGEVLCYYEQVFGAARHPAVASVLFAARPRLERMVDDVLTTTGFGGRVDAGLVVAVVDGAALGALSARRTDVAAFVSETLSRLLDRA